MPDAAFAPKVLVVGHCSGTMLAPSSTLLNPNNHQSSHNKLEELTLRKAPQGSAPKQQPHPERRLAFPDATARISTSSSITTQPRNSTVPNKPYPHLHCVAVQRIRSITQNTSSNAPDKILYTHRERYLATDLLPGPMNRRKEKTEKGYVTPPLFPLHL